VNNSKTHDLILTHFLELVGRLPEAASRGPGIHSLSIIQTVRSTTGLRHVEDG
jgi:hypothetical protein